MAKAKNVVAVPRSHGARRGRRRYVGALGHFEALEPRLLLSTNINVTGSTADNAVNSVGGFRFIGDQSVRVGDNGTNANEQDYVIPFQLPTIPTGDGVTGASLSVYLQLIGNTPSGNTDVYGLGWRSSPTILATDYYEGSYGGDATDATPIENAIFTPTQALGTVTTTTAANTALANYIKAQYAAGAPAGSYVFLRFNAQSDQAISRFWTLSSSDNTTTPSQKPVLTISFDPLVTVPAAPSNLTSAVTGSTSIHLAWHDNSSNETGFVVERSTNGTSFTAIATTAANATSYDDATGLSANTLYYYRVKAINAGGSSAYTATASNTTLPSFNRTIWVNLNSTATTPDGTYNNAYKTISAGLAVAVAGNGVVVRGATYSGRTNISVSGASGNPITLMAAPGERTILSGFTPISGWTLNSGNIYVTTVTSSPSSLYAGMSIQEQSRSPDGGWYVWQSETTGTQTVITDTAHLTGISNLTGATVELHIGSSNLEGSFAILAADPVAGTITIQAVAGLSPTDIYMIKNRLSLVTQPGEWASENQGNGTFKVYYWPKNVSDLSITQVPSVTTSLVTVSSGVHNLVISGFEVAGSKASGIDIEHADSVVVTNNITHDNAADGIFFRYDTNVTASNNLSVMNNGGIVISSVVHGLVTQNEIAYNANDGLDLTGDISGKVPGDAGFSPSDDITASDNYIHNQSYINHSDGIQLYRWLTNVHITDNLVINNEQGFMSEEVDDVADPGTSTMTGNIFWGSSADLVIFGHSNSNNWTVANNTIGGPGLGLFQMTGTGYTFNDNVIVGMIDARSYTGDHNLVWTIASDGAIFRNAAFTKFTTIAAWNTYSGQDAHSVKGDPLFTNVPLLNSEANVVGSTASVLNLRSAAGFAVGDHVEVAKDGVVRTITAISGNNITLNIPLSGPPVFAMAVYDWGTRTNFQWNFSLAAGSPGLTMSSTGGRVGSVISAPQYMADDFNGDGKRDTPAVPSDLHFPPDLSFWAT